MSKIVKIDDDGLTFDDGYVLTSFHVNRCCENHWLDWAALRECEVDVTTLEFDLTGILFERVPDFGIRLIASDGHPIFVAGYGSNNGYYSDQITMQLLNPIRDVVREWDVSECQDY